MIKHSLTHTPREKQKHNQDNNRQKYVGDDVNQDQIWAYLRFLGDKVPPKKYKPVLLLKFRNLNMG